MTENLLQPYALNDKITLNNRIVMAPMTRCMADDALVPTQAMAEYYARRAGAGLIITEATIIRPDAQGYPNTPGIFSAAQIEGWRNVTCAVHNNGGKIFSQIWHCGRVSHSHFFGGDVLAPSAVQAEGTVPRMRELVYEVPKPATQADIQSLIEDHAQAAANAIEADFDGVEIHAANGYLVDQFLHYHTNQRDDEYGGSPENMSRFALEIVDAVIARVGAERTAIRLSPGAYFNMQGDNRDRAVSDYLLAELEKRNLAYVHIGVFDDSMTFDYLEGTASEYVRANYSNTLMAVGGFNPESGSQGIAENKFDLLAIGRPFIANPDLVERVKEQGSLVEYDDSMLGTLV